MIEDIQIPSREGKERNPIKEIATHLAHQMDREKALYENENYYPREIELVREEGNYLRNEIIRKGYNVSTVLHYAEEYKTLGFKEYFEWIYI